MVRTKEVKRRDKNYIKGIIILPCTLEESKQYAGGDSTDTQIRSPCPSLSCHLEVSRHREGSRQSLMRPLGT